MNIERDKWYVLRNGEKVRVVCVDAPGEWPVICMDANGSLYKHTKSGIFCVANDGDELDIIREHREPARVWVNFYPSGECYSFGTEKAARASSNEAHTRIAVEFVEVEK